MSLMVSAKFADDFILLFEAWSNLMDNELTSNVFDNVSHESKAFEAICFYINVFLNFVFYFKLLSNKIFPKICYILFAVSVWCFIALCVESNVFSSNIFCGSICHDAVVKLILLKGSTFFSSPELKVLRVSYCDRSLSVVRRRPSSVDRRA